LTKRSKKPCQPGSAPDPLRAPQESKVFWFFFSKKNILPVMLLLTAAVAEPDSYRQSDYRAPVPQTLKGAAVVTTSELAAMLSRGHVILFDVVPAPIRPPDRPAAMPWMPLPHDDIPGSIWLPGTGRGTLDARAEAWFAGRVRAVAASHPGDALVFYCLSHCWMSWNAARRAVLLGVPHVVWYPDGADGWEAAGHSLSPAAAESPPLG
jgi:PQQ-dependent catabolism-associated CXXCW motif protein